MKEENLMIPKHKLKRDSSYLGEITPEVDNVMQRDFQANYLYEKLLTYITEFALPDVKLYLSILIALMR